MALGEQQIEYLFEYQTIFSWFFVGCFPRREGGRRDETNPTSMFHTQVPAFFIIFQYNLASLILAVLIFGVSVVLAETGG